MFEEGLALLRWSDLFQQQTRVSLRYQILLLLLPSYSLSQIEMETAILNL